MAEQLGLAGAIFIEGLCFVPLGLSMALAISIYADGIQKRSTLLAAGALAGFAFGGFAVFSIFGGLLGLIVLGGILTGGLSLISDPRAARVVIGFLGLAAFLYLLILFGGNEIVMRVMLILYPLPTLGIVGAIGIFWAALLGYGLVLFVLLLLWPRTQEIKQ